MRRTDVFMTALTPKLRVGKSRAEKNPLIYISCMTSSTPQIVCNAISHYCAASNPSPSKKLEHIPW